MSTKSEQVFVFIVFFCLCAGYAAPALATQTHGEPEGLYVHLIAHGIFFTAMVYLSVRLVRSGDWEQAGWRLILWSALLFSLWNVDTALVHVYQEILHPRLFDGDFHGLSRTFHPRSPGDLLFYAGRLDHLLSLPALLCLFLGIRRLLKDREGGAWT